MFGLVCAMKLACHLLQCLVYLILNPIYLSYVHLRQAVPQPTVYSWRPTPSFAQSLFFTRYLFSCQTVEAFWTSIKYANPICVGLNCALGPSDLRPYVEKLSEIAKTNVHCYPNAGLPNEFGAKN